jgi:hypothetical protein
VAETSQAKSQRTAHPKAASAGRCESVQQCAAVPVQ